MRNRAAIHEPPLVASPSPPRRVRLAPDDRRRHLLEVASEILTRRGVDALQFTELAAAAGVSRPVVYKFFPTRAALLTAVLEDFDAEMSARFRAGAARGLPADLAEATRVFVEAVCDTIEGKGAGPWHLLESKGPDPDAARVGLAIKRRMLRPWQARIAATTGASKREVATVAEMMVAVVRAVVERWHGGSLTRDEAVRDATRGVTALLRAFTAPSSTA